MPRFRRTGAYSLDIKVLGFGLLLDSLKLLFLLLGLSFQNLQTGSFLLDLKLGDRQMFFRAAAFTALHICVSGISHGIVGIILQDAVRFSEDRLSVGIENRIIIALF